METAFRFFWKFFQNCQPNFCPKIQEETYRGEDIQYTVAETLQRVAERIQQKYGAGRHDTFHAERRGSHVISAHQQVISTL